MRWLSILVLAGCIASPLRAESLPLAERLAQDFVHRLESSDPRVVAENAAQSILESKWEAARQVWAVYDPIVVERATVVSSRVTADAVELELSLDARGAVASAWWVALPRDWRVRYVRQRGRWTPAEAHFGEEEILAALQRPGFDLELEPTPLTLAILRKYTVSPPTPRNTAEVADLAERLAARAGDPVSRVMALLARVTAERNALRLDAALEHGCEALDIAESLQSPDLIAMTGLTTAFVLRRKEQPEQAIELYRSIAALRPALRDPTLAVSAILAAAVQQANLGRDDVAMQLNTEAMQTARALGWREGAAVARYNIGGIYDVHKDLELAEAEYVAAANELAAIGSRYPEAAVRLDLGLLQYFAGRPEEALASEERALALIPPDRGLHRAGALEIVADIQRERGHLREAEASIAEALKIANDLGGLFDQMTATGGMFRIAMAKGDFEAALDDARRLSVLAAKLDRDHASALMVMGEALRCLGRADEARQMLEGAVASIEEERTLFSGDDEHLSQYFRDKSEAYRELVELSVDQGQPLEAMHWLDRLKGRAIQDAMRRHSAGVSLASGERATEKRLDDEIRRLNRATRAARDSRRAAALLRQLDDARTTLDRFRAEMAIRHPFVEPERGDAVGVPVDVEALTANGDVLVLDYLAAPDATLLFALSGPGRVAVHRIPMSGPRLQALVHDLERRITQRDLSYVVPARRLFALLLGPVAKELATHRLVRVIPDGILWRVPFAALVDGRGRSVVDRVPVAYSLSLAMLQASATRRARVRQPALFAVGNPTVSEGTKTAMRSLHPGASLGSLPEAEKEVREIARLYGGRRNRVLIGSAAAEDTVKRDAPRFDILHFATHGVSDDRRPMYSGLLLARGGDAAEDGILEAREITDLALRAELAILSACDTARGDVRGGEGVIGLSWSFLAAGVPATVVSQWKAESAATAKLMIELHRRLRDGAPVAEALRDAERQLRREPAHTHPFYWAPFIVVGEVPAERAAAPMPAPRR